MARFGSAIALAVMVIAQTGCFSQKKSEPASTTQGKGEFGVYYLVSLPTPVGGTIRSSDGQIDCGTAGGTSNACGPARYAWRTTATLEATADAGYTFYGWAGDCSGTGSCVVDNTFYGADKTIAAVFTLGSSWSLTALKTGGGAGTIGAAISGQPPVTCAANVQTCTFDVPIANPGTVVALTATPDASSYFAGWSGACTGTATCTLEVAKPAIVNASFRTFVAGGTEVGSGGGSVQTSTGVIISIPPVAVDTATQFDVTEAINPPPLPEGIQPVTPVYHFEPAGQVFALPVTVRLPVPPDVTSACIWWQEHLAAAYECIGGTVVDGFIEVDVSHFSDAFVGPLPLTRTVQGTRFNTHLVSSGQPFNSADGLENEVVAAWVRDAGSGLSRFPGRGYADGTFQIPGLPATGNVIVQVGSSATGRATLVATTGSSLDLGRVINGRQGLVNLAGSSPMPVNFQVDGLDPYQAGDEIDAFSLDADVWFDGLEGFGLPVGSTSFSVSDLRSSRTTYLPLRVIDGATDQIFVTQMSAASSGNGLPYQQLRRFGRVQGVTVGPFSPAQTAGVTLGAVSQGNSLSLDWNLPGYRSMLTQAGLPSCNVATSNFQVRGQAAALGFGLSPGGHKRVYLDSSFGAGMPAVSTGPMTFGTPSGTYQASWGIHWAATANCSATMPGPNSAPVTVGTGITQFGTYVPPATAVSLQQPDLSPPRNVTVNGLPLTSPLTDVADGPLIGWDPPAIGTPDLYTVGLIPFGGGTGQIVVVTLHTQNRLVRVPPGILTKGGSYVVRVTASKGGGQISRPGRLTVPDTQAWVTVPWFTVSANQHRIGGTVSGLTGIGLVLATAGQPDLTVIPGATGFNFSSSAAPGTAYAVTVKQQPSSPGQICSVSSGSGSVGAGDVMGIAVTCQTQVVACGDLAEQDVSGRWSASASEGPGGPFTTRVVPLGRPDARTGLRAVRVVTNAGFDVALSYSAPSGQPIDATGAEQLRFMIRAFDGNFYGWQGMFPVVVLRDTSGNARTFTPTTNLLPKDGVTWFPIVLPLAGSSAWAISGPAVNLASISRIEIHADTWDYGFTLDVDGMSFNRASDICATGTGWVQVATGDLHSVGLKADGTVWTWGTNSAGQLGTGDTTSRSTPVKVGSGFVQVAAGNLHTVALKADGTVWTWGSNVGGELGDGTNTNRSLPFQVGPGFTSVAAGGHQTFGVKADGTLWGWGWNADGQLGDGTNTDRPAPVPIGSGFERVATGEIHSVGIKRDGTLWAWGANAQGQVGDGTTTPRPTPVQVGTGYAQAAAGAYFTFGIQTDGTLKAWGANFAGQLGDGTGAQRSLPVTVGSGYVQVAAGDYHALAVRTDGTLQAWGLGTDGRLGTGNTSTTFSPMTIGTGYSQAAAGGGHSLGVKADGSIWGWGRNDAGQVGNGTSTQATSPTLVLGGSGGGAP